MYRYRTVGGPNVQFRNSLHLSYVHECGIAHRVQYAFRKHSGKEIHYTCTRTTQKITRPKALVDCWGKNDGNSAGLSGLVSGDPNPCGHLLIVTSS